MRGDVSDHARDANVGRRDRSVGNEHVEQLVFGIGAPSAVFEQLAKPRAVHECAGIQLHLVGKVGAFGDEAAVVALVGLDV